MSVIAGEVDHYDSLLCEAGAAVFGRNGWRMMISSESNSQLDGIAPPPGLMTKLLHLWEIPGFDSLPNVMAAAADNNSYVIAEQLTINEMQNLYTTLRWDDPIGLAPSTSGLFMVETLQVDNNMSKRNDFATYMDNAIYDMNTKYGWRIEFAGNAATGIIDQYVHIWQVPSFDNLTPQIREYRMAPKWSAVITEVRTELWKTHPLGCLAMLSDTNPHLQAAYAKTEAAKAAKAAKPG